MLYYSIAHYFDVSSYRRENKFKNIENHIKTFLNLNIKNKQFILVTSINNTRGDEKYDIVKKELEDYCNKLIPNNNFHIIVKFNWGGTIAALWECYLFLKSINAKGSNIAHFEEDFGPKNNLWYDESVKLLESNNNIYVGESNIGRIKSHNDDKRFRNKAFKNHPRLGFPEVWTDGGFYFSSLEKLKNIEKKIDIFHKGNNNKQYNRDLDGISLGEVGFPTLLYHNGFNFKVLNRSDYFIHEWND